MLKYLEVSGLYIVLYGGKIQGTKLIMLFSQTVDTIGT
jgi:hypothetical protein